ncbi:hypothetical protein SRHO_G00038120 [Serrasalmus rhombeus]
MDSIFMNNLSHHNQSFLRLGGSAIAAQRHKGKVVPPCIQKRKNVPSRQRTERHGNPNSAPNPALHLMSAISTVSGKKKRRSCRANCWWRAKQGLDSFPGKCAVTDKVVQTQFFESFGRRLHLFTVNQLISQPDKTQTNVPLQ